MADDTSTTSTEPTGEPAATVEQPDLGDAGKRALSEERKAKRDAEKRAADLESRLKQFEDAQKTSEQRLAERAEAAERDLAAVRLDATRSRVALAKGLPADLVEFLTGPDEESLAEQADRLLSRLTAPSGAAPVAVPAGVRTTPLALNGDPLTHALEQKLGIR